MKTKFRIALAILTSCILVECASLPITGEIQFGDGKSIASDGKTMKVIYKVNE